MHRAVRFASTRLALAAIVLAGTLVSARSARADFDTVDLFRTAFSTQSGPAAPTTVDSYRFNARAFLQGANDFDSVTLTSPGPVMQTLTQDSPTLFSFGQSFAAKSGIDAAYPFGTYTFDGANSVSMTTGTASLNYSADAFPTTFAAVTAATYNGLQGMNAAQAFSIALNPFGTNPLATESFIFLTIRDSSFNVVFNAGFLPPTTTSVSLAAGTLLANMDYSIDLVYSTRVTLQSSGPQEVLGFDNRTGLSFHTRAVPEPSSLALLALGVVVVGRRLRRSRDRG